jgi:hypothetical protein
VEKLGIGKFTTPCIVLKKLPFARIGIFSERTTSGPDSPPLPHVQLSKRL